ncbi:MAG: hypothetical protein DHS20C11_32840 [Lysobacteraceae bacterium]|nr:MAG: hypothetical protein DHS20C11_32840 [Xanthomonadaceae bacterium]
MSTTMTIRLDHELKERLDQLAKSTDRSRSYLAAVALRDYVEINEWQIREIEQAVVEAEAEDFASAESVNKTLSKWGTDLD